MRMGMQVCDRVGIALRVTRSYNKDQCYLTRGIYCRHYTLLSLIDGFVIRICFKGLFAASMFTRWLHWLHPLSTQSLPIRFIRCLRSLYPQSLCHYFGPAADHLRHCGALHISRGPQPFCAHALMVCKRRRKRVHFCIGFSCRPRLNAYPIETGYRTPPRKDSSSFQLE